MVKLKTVIRGGMTGAGFFSTFFLSFYFGWHFVQLLISKLVHEVFFGEECMARKDSRGSPSCSLFLSLEENEILLYP